MRGVGVFVVGALTAVGVYTGVKYYFSRNETKGNDRGPTKQSENPNYGEARKRALLAAERRWEDQQVQRHEARAQLDNVEVDIKERNLNSPERYQPTYQGSTVLDLHETVHVEINERDRVPAKALLDTGNAGVTLVVEQFAKQAGLIGEGVTQRPLGTYTVTGVIPGASIECHCIPLKYQVRGYTLSTRAAVLPTEHGKGNRWEILVAADDIKELQSAGFTLKL